MKEFWQKVWEKIKAFFKDLWADVWPLLQTGITLGLNWLLNWIKNRISYNKFAKLQQSTFNNIQPTMDYKTWKKSKGFPNPWAKSHGKAH